MATLAVGQSATVSFDYRIEDAFGETDAATVTVTIEGVNDNPVAEDAEFTIAENTDSGVAIGSVTATDVDAGDGLSFAIVAGNTTGGFTIDNNGLITVDNKAALDFETSPTFHLTVDVTDGHGGSDTAAVIVHLTDLQATISINDVAGVEGGTGTTTPFGFVVTLAGDVVNVPFDVSYATTDNTASVSDADFLGTGGAANFAGTVAAEVYPVIVIVNGDAKVEQHETFFVDLLGIAGTNDVTIDDGRGTGTIENDDFLVGRVFDDLDNDGVFDTADGDAGIAGVRMRLVNEATGLVVDQDTTGTDGSYEFDVTLEAGTYKIVEVVDELAELGLLDGQETAGVNGGTVDNLQDSNEITGIDISGGGGAAHEAAIDYLFAEIRPSDAFGSVWRDFNDDGEINFGEAGIDEAIVELTGVDDRGQSVSQSAATSADGSYAFIDLRPGNYAISEVQPTGFEDGKESLGEVTDLGVPTAVADPGYIDGNDKFSGIELVPGSEADRYNFGERPQAGDQIGDNVTATIGFWHNKNGEAMIESLNGGSAATQLGNWLAATFPHIYGPDAFYDAASGEDQEMYLAGKTNAEIAEIFQFLHNRNKKTAVAGGPPKVDAQVLAVALATYATSETLAGGNYAAAYGFNTSADGIAYTTFNVLDVLSTQEADELGLTPVMDAAGHATIIDILLATDEKAHEGLLYDADDTGTISSFETLLRTLANELYTAINEGSDI